MLGHAQARLGVRAEDVQRASVVVIVEVGGAGGASRGQDAAICGELAAHGVSLHLQRGSCPLVTPALIVPRERRRKLA